MSGDLIQQLGSLNLNRDLKGPKVEIPGVADAVKQLRILLECLIVHAVEADLAPRHQFQQEIKIVAESLREDIATPDLEMAIGKTVRAVEDYHHQASDAFKRQVSELRALFALMAETAAFIATGNEATVQQMALVEAKLKQAVRLQDPRQMRTFMEESLALVLAEIKRVESEARAKTAALDSAAMAAEANAKQAAAFRIEKDFQIHDRNALVVITCSVHFTRIPVNAQSALISGTLDAALVRA